MFNYSHHLESITSGQHAVDYIYKHENVNACSVCLSHSCTLLKPFNGFRCHLVRTLARSNDTLC